MIPKVQTQAKQIYIIFWHNGWRGNEVCFCGTDGVLVRDPSGVYTGVDLVIRYQQRGVYENSSVG